MKRDFLNWLKSAPCSRCGNFFPPVAMDFDHVEGKKFAISKITNLPSIEKIQEELLKCQLLCANCHRIKTFLYSKGFVWGSKIDGVRVKKLVTHSDDRGSLRELYRANDLFLEGIPPFRQSNVTTAFPGVIKAFHYHKRQWDVWSFVAGSAQIVLFDQREESKTRRVIECHYPNSQNHLLVAIPPGVAHGYRVLGTEPATLIYHVTEVYDGSDEYRIPYDDKQIDFDWTTRNR